MGTVTIRMRGECITSFHFSVPWPKEAYHPGTHWLPSNVEWRWQGGRHRFSTSWTSLRQTLCTLRCPRESGGPEWEPCPQSWKQFWTAIIASQKASRSSGQAFRKITAHERTSQRDTKMLLKEILEYIARHCRLPLADNSGGSGTQGHGTILATDYGLQTHQHLRRPVESQIC